MPPLAELQRSFADSLMAGDPVPTPIKGCLRPDEAMRIHRNTVMGALVGALRLSYPTVDALVGEAFFDRAACTFAQSQPPHAAALSLYGDGFAAFLADFTPCAGLPYLADVARLDFAIEHALQGANDTRRFDLDAAVAITLPRTLTALTLRYPADEIRAAIGDDAAMKAIVLDASERHHLVWRQDRTARLRAVHPLSGRFLAALLAGAPAQTALEAAGGSDPAVLAQLQADIFTAPFCSIISNPKGPSS